MAITMNEIAAKLNLSIATVSRALSGKNEGVSEETRSAILAAAEEFGYQKRRVVGKSVAFVIDKDLFNSSSQFYAGIISGVEEELIKNRYYFQFNSVDAEGFDLAKINLNFSDLAGVIMVGIYHEDFVLKLKNMDVPMVLVDENIPSESFQTVLIDNTDGIIRACKYLAELGHTRVAYLSKEKNEASAYERYYGFRHSSELFGFDKDERLVAESQMRIDSAFESMMTILERLDEPPTAVLAYNDIIALGAMSALQQYGLSIPSDVSVVGFDDIRLARESVPPLTTVHVPKKLMGAVAVQRLLHVIQGQSEPLNKVLIPTKLKIRESTAPPRGSTQKSRTPVVERNGRGVPDGEATAGNTPNEN